MVYNVHMRCHLTDDARKYGALDSVSAFPFETFLGTLKRLVRSPNKTLQQIHRRMSELHTINTEVNCFSDQNLLLFWKHDDGPTLDCYLPCTQYKKLIYGSYEYQILSSSKADSCVITSSKDIVKIINIIKTKYTCYLICQQFRKPYRPFF